MTDNTPSQATLLEIYKLHANLADNIHQRREGANRQYIIIVNLLIMAMIVAIRFIEFNDDIHGLVLLVIGITGMLSAANWFELLLSYNNMHHAKISALMKLEDEIHYSFLKNEDEYKIKEHDKAQIVELTKTERMVPFVFFCLFAMVIACALIIKISQNPATNMTILLGGATAIYVIVIICTYITMQKREKACNNKIDSKNSSTNGEQK